MDSINQNQPEDVFANVEGHDAVAKIKEMVSKAHTCFFCTALSTGPSGGTRPMSVRLVDDQGNLWFLSAVDSHKNNELAVISSVRLFFQGSAHSDFLVLEGHGEVSADRSKVRELWHPMIKTWFTDGVDDPRITVIKVVPSAGYYWDTKHGGAIAGMKMLVGVVIGKTLDDSIEGTVKM